jgi:PAS domain S-box-containing protein
MPVLLTAAMNRRQTRKLLPYGVAIGSTAIALLLSLWLELFLPRSIGAFFYIAIIVSAWYGGLRAGSVAVVLSMLAIDYFFLPPVHQFWHSSPEDILRLGIFLLVALVINLLTSNLQESKKKIERLNKQLIQENAEQLRMALSAARMGMWDWNLVTKEVKWSPEHALLLGLEPGTFDGKYETFDALVHPEDRAGLNQALEQALQTKSIYQHEFRVIWSDGSIHWVEGRGHGFYDQRNQAVRMTGTIVNIDDRKQIETLLHQQSEQQRLVMEISGRIRQSLNLQDILQTTVEEVRRFLQCDRALVFKIAPDYSGTILVESVDAAWNPISSNHTYDPCVGEEYIAPFKQGLVTAKSDIYTAQIAPCHLEMLVGFQVRANLVVPILQGENLWGLLIAHHCAAPREWQASEIELLRQLSAQASIAIQQADLFEQVQKEALRIQTLFNTSFDAIVILDRQGKVLDANPRFAQMLGYTPEEIKSINIFDWDANFTPEELQQLLDDQEDAETRRTGDAERDSSQDRSNESQAREFIRGEQENSSLLESPDLIAGVSPRPHVSVSPRPLQFIAAKNGVLETRHRRKDGSICDVEISASVVEWQGEILRFCVCRDITERKQAQIALQQLNAELEQRVQERTAEVIKVNESLLTALLEKERAYQLVQEQAQLLDLAHDSIITWDLNSVITFWNQGAESMYGWSKAEALGQNPHVLLKIQFPQPLAEIEVELLEKGYWEGEIINFCREDRPVIVASRWVAQKDDAGRLIKILEINNDISDRKQAEQMLQLQAVITRNMAEGICLVRFDNGVIVYANPKFEQMFGYDSGELNGQLVSIVNYTTESLSAEDVNQTIRSAVLQSGEFTYEVHNVKKDGTPFWCSVTCSVFRHPDYGDVLVAVHQDITDRKQAEEALRQKARQEELLRCITQAIRQSLDLKAILNTAVTEVRQTLQSDRAAIYRFNLNWSGDFVVESVAKDWVKLVGVDVQKVWEDTYLQETQGGRFRHNENYVVNDIYQAGLQPCHIELLEQFQAKSYAIFPIFLGENLWGLLATYQNSTSRSWQSWEVELLQQIASQLSLAIQQSELYGQLQIKLQERKQAEATIREAERRWRSLLDNVHLIVVGLDTAGNLNYVNPFFLSLTGYTNEEVLGKNWFDKFLPRSSKQLSQNIFSEVLNHNSHPYYRNAILTKSGEERFIAWNNTMLQDSKGTVIGTISIGEDITERQKIEQIKDEFIGIVSHELRTPLTAIQMSLGLLKTGIYDKKPEKSRRMIEIALLDTNRLVNLVNDILDLERLESGRAVLEKTVCKAADLMQQAVDGIEAIATQQQISLIVTPTDAEVWAAADAIIQTLTNLLSNGIKFSPAHATIHLSAEPQTDCVLFKVSDRGRGIPADKLELIFGRFQQVDASDSREKGGTGLGLAICRSIIERHGGKIWAESILGEGSTFFFTLPLPLDIVF